LSNPPPSDPLQQPDGTTPPENPQGQQASGKPASEHPATEHPVSGQPWSTPSGDSLSIEAYQPPPTPPTPTFQPGYASLPKPPPEPQYPPTSQFPALPGYAHPPYSQPGYSEQEYSQPGYEQPGYSRPGYGQQGYHQPGYDQPGVPPSGYPAPGHSPASPRRSNVPFVAVIVAVALLLCGGAATATVLIARNVANGAKEAIKPITHPVVPTEVPNFPGVPTDLPTLPTDLPNLPGLPNSGKKITVAYEVTGDGPAEILYTTKLGEKPKRVQHAKLPWRLTTTMDGAALISVSAVREGQDDGTIKCRASIDGDQAAQASRDGAFAAVSCTKFVFN
jgi:hypothetical protein